ncbi:MULTISPECIES: hypothetical protein [Bacillus]|uniref:hypothetical protein n=1 Tax=Bacillus TaxID=1386 RepID=UPI0011A585C4|nr:hypothetical protein [Bacillus licheniformis]MCA1183036.1 hypothetical protein [Bacillus licheniformis]TWL46231.1 hypothetical protein CHCC15543_4502 [Bacillus licheniformis]
MNEDHFSDFISDFINDFVAQFTKMFLIGASLIVGVLILLSAPIWFPEVCRFIFELVEYAKEKRMKIKRFKTTKSQLNTFHKLEKKINDICKKTYTGFSKKAEKDFYGEINVLRTEMQRTLSLINPQRTEQNEISLYNFPDAFNNLMYHLIQYEISIDTISDQLFNIVKQPYSKEHIQHIKEIINDMNSIIIAMNKDIENELKQHYDLRNRLIASDINHAKEAVNLEKLVISRNKTGVSESNLNLTKRSLKDNNNSNVYDQSLTTALFLNPIFEGEHSNIKNELNHTHHTSSYDSGGSFDGGSF